MATPARVKVRRFIGSHAIGPFRCAKADQSGYLPVPGFKGREISSNVPEEDDGMMVNSP
jgi:hypothetical protein